MDNLIREMELSVEELGTRSWKIYSSNLKIILLIVVTVFLPINALIEVINNMLTTQTYSEFVAKNTANLLSLIQNLLSVLATLALAYLTEQQILDKETDYAEVFSKALGRWLSGIGTFLLSGIIVLLMALLLIIPGIIWGVYYAFALFAVILRKEGGMDALGYSKSLVKNRWWKVFGILLLSSVVQIVLGASIGFITNFLPVSFVLNIIINTTLDFLGAFFTIFAVVFFLNLDYLTNSSDWIKE
ncbi:MAG: hypothetical protein ACOZCL_10325 [Bacillota bacterium]